MSQVRVPDPLKSIFGQYSGMLVPLVAGCAVPITNSGETPLLVS
jgi:hypothetical protein